MSGTSSKVIALFILVLGVCQTVTARELDTRQALDMLEGSIQSIRSFDVRFSVTSRSFLIMEKVAREKVARADELKKARDLQKKTPRVPTRHRLTAGEKPPETTVHFRQVFQAGRGRIEFLDKEGRPTRFVVCDRETEKAYRPATASCLIRLPAANIIQEGGDYLESFRNLYGRAETIKSFRLRKNLKVMLATPPGKSIVFYTALDRHPTDPNIDLPTWGFRVIIDPDKNFLPVKIERDQLIQEKPFVARRTTIDRFLDVGQGILVPVKFTSIFFDPFPGETFGDRALEVVTTVDVSHSSWNKPIPEDTFILPLPAGVRVTDKFRNISFVTGKPDPGNNLKELARNARDMVPFNTQRVPRQHAPYSINRRLWIPAVLGAVAFILACFRIWIVRRNRGREEGK